MKSKTYKILLMTMMVMALMTYSCADLNVENLVEPDTARALANPSDLMGVAGGAFKTVHNQVQDYDGPALAMANMADQMTCSWGNASMRDLGKEPRLGFNNKKTYAYYPVVSEPWAAIYSAISSVNDVLKAIDDGMKFGTNGADNKMVESWCYFVSGAAHSYVALIYDKGNLINWDTDVSSVPLVGWEAVRDGALALLDKAIALADANSFTLPIGWVAGQTMTNAGLSKLANSYAARTLAYASRNKAHNDAVIWTKVLGYANKGIIVDFAPTMGTAYNWSDTYWAQGCYSGWARIDCRIINIMQNSYVSRWPDLRTAAYPDITATCPDKRLGLDYGYLSAQSFPPDRGYYFFTNYRYKRYDYINASTFVGDKPKPSFLAWENEMLKAEAKARTGDIPGAKTILNSPTGARKVRGQLPDVTATVLADVLRIIWDEKDVELPFSGVGISFFDMRRTDRLTTGTILHFPVPVGELEIANIPAYTIEGAPDGINISNGSWTGYTK